MYEATSIQRHKSSNNLISPTMGYKNSRIAVDEVTTNWHDKTDIAKSGLEKNGNVPDVNGFDDDAPESSDGWSRDTKNGSYEGSTVWWLLKWLIDNDNYKTWRDIRPKSTLYDTIAILVNKHGEEEQGVKRERTGAGIGQKMNYFFRNMKACYIKLEDERRFPVIGQKPHSKFKYYDYLYLVMADDLRKHYEELKSKEEKKKKNKPTTVALPHVEERKEELGAPKISHDERMAELERKHQETKVKFANIQMLGELRKTGYYTKEEIAMKFPEFVPLFKCNDMTEEIKTNYNEWAKKNGLPGI
jgi:hypothetical protein